MATSRAEPLSTDRDTRQRLVDDAVHSSRMEGLEVGPDWAANAGDYVDGRLYVDGLVARTRARYGFQD